MIRKLFRTYSFGTILKLGIDFIRTRLYVPQATLIRFPIDIRGKRFIHFGRGLTTGRGCRIEAYPVDDRSKAVFFGQNIQINDYVHITGMNKVVIGDNVLIASKVYISDCTHGSYEGGDQDSDPGSIPKERPYVVKEVIIGDNVWLGEMVSILPGVTIGKGSIVGANSVVTKDLPDYVIAVGIPAKAVKRYNFETGKWEKIEMNKQ